MPSTAYNYIKRISICIALCCLLTFFYMEYVRQCYTRQMPEHPSPEQHRVIPIGVNYGKTVYVTADEARYINRLYKWAMAAGLIILFNFKIYQHPEIIIRKRRGKTEAQSGRDH